MSDIMQKLRNAYPSLPNAKKTAASYFLNNYHSLPFATVTDLAASIGVSDTTIINLCVDLGFSGFSEFKRTLRAEVQGNRPNLPSNNETAVINEDLTRLITPIISNITATFSDPHNCAALDQTVDLLGNADTIYAIGFWTFALAAQELCQQLRRYRWKAEAIFPDLGDYMDKVLLITPKDAVILFDFSRYITGLTEICLMLKKQGVPIILITDLGPCPRHPYADIAIHCHLNTLKPVGTLPISMLVNYILRRLLNQRFPHQTAEYETLREGVFTRFNPYGVVEPDPRHKNNRI